MGSDGADITVDESVEGMKVTLEHVAASDLGSSTVEWDGTPMVRNRTLQGLLPDRS